MKNVEVEKQHNESAANLIRRFSKRMQSAGVLGRARKLRSYDRGLSPVMRKKKTLAALRRRAEREKLVKLGKLPEHPGRR